MLRMAISRERKRNVRKMRTRSCKPDVNQTAFQGLNLVCIKHVVGQGAFKESYGPGECVIRDEDRKMLDSHG